MLEQAMFVIGLFPVACPKRPENRKRVTEHLKRIPIIRRDNIGDPAVITPLVRVAAYAIPMRALTPWSTATPANRCAITRLDNAYAYTGRLVGAS